MSATDLRLASIARTILARLDASAEAMTISGLVRSMNGNPDDPTDRGDVVGALRLLERRALVNTRKVRRPGSEALVSLVWRVDQPEKAPEAIR